MAACWMLSKRHISISKLALARPDPWATWLALTSAPSALHDQVMNSRWSHGLAANFASLCVAVSARSRVPCLFFSLRSASKILLAPRPTPARRLRVTGSPNWVADATTRMRRALCWGGGWPSLLERRRL